MNKNVISIIEKKAASKDVVKLLDKGLSKILTSRPFLYPAAIAASILYANAKDPLIKGLE